MREVQAQQDRRARLHRALDTVMDAIHPDYAAGYRLGFSCAEAGRKISDQELQKLAAGRDANKFIQGYRRGWSMGPAQR